MCYPGIHECTSDVGTNRETTGEGPGLRKNNLVRIIVRVKRRIDELRVEVAVKERFKNKLVRNRLKWACQVEIMGDENLPKRADAQKLEGNCRKRDIERVEEEWRKRATDRRNWRLLIENLVR